MALYVKLEEFAFSIVFLFSLVQIMEFFLLDLAEELLSQSASVVSLQLKLN